MPSELENLWNRITGASEREPIRLMRPVGIELRGKNLRFPEDARAKIVGAPQLLLDDVEAIQTPADVLQVARRYGFLHSEGDSPSKGGFFREPVAEWFETAKSLRALRAIGRAVELELMPPRPLLELLGRNGMWKSLQSVDDVRTVLASALTRLLRASNIRPSVSWNRRSRHWHLNLATFGELSINIGCMAPLTLYLVREIMGGRQAFCSICGHEYYPPRAPRSGANNYCDTCKGSPEMWRRLKAKQRSKRAPAK